jgi:subtilisin family serine protease
MRTVIVRLAGGPAGLNVVGEQDVLSAAGPKERYSALAWRFREMSRGIDVYLEGLRAHTRQRYVAAFGESERGELDILSSESPIKSGVVHYEPLLPSDAYAVTASEDVIEHLLRSESVERIHANYVYELPDPDVLSGPPAEPSLGAWHLDHLGLGGADRQNCGRSIKVAVLDSGIDPGHREFSPRQVAGFQEWDDLGRPLPNKGAGPGSPRDTHGHGTHVSGIIWGATTGIAPAVDLYVGLVAPQGRTTFAQVNQGLAWAARRGVDVVNLSLGKPGYRPELEQMVQFASALNVLLVAAIGNDGPGTHRSPGDHQAALAVGAVDAGKKVWAKSAGAMISTGPAPYRKPDLYAPGVDVCSAFPNNMYKVWSGTSMAAPAVAGVAAVLKSHDPAMTVAELRQHVLQNCAPIALPSALGGTGLLLGGTAYIPPRQIAARAFGKYLARGGQPGLDQRDWYEALQELRLAAPPGCARGGGDMTSAPGGVVDLGDSVRIGNVVVPKRQG